MSTSQSEQIPSKIATVLYYGVRVFVALSVLVFLFRGEWSSAFSACLIFVLMLLPAFLKSQYRVYLPFGLEVAVTTFIFLTLFLGSLANFYEQILWWDDMLHIVSGFLFGLLGFIVVYELNDERVGKLNLSPLFVAVFSICFSLALSVVWEIYEFGADQLLGFTMQRDGIMDTMIDLIANAVAALVVGVFAYLWMRKQKKVPFTERKLSRFQYTGRSK
jgi:hypothetical protein